MGWIRRMSGEPKTVPWIYRILVWVLWVLVGSIICKIITKTSAKKSLDIVYGKTISQESKETEESEEAEDQKEDKGWGG